MVCVWTEDTGLIPPEAMLEVATAVWTSKPSGEAISFIERVKLSEELLNYRQRANKGLMSFQDFTAWHSRISQVPYSIPPHDDSAANLRARGINSDSYSDDIHSDMDRDKRLRCTPPRS